jgi:hypothetical protein
MPPYGIMLFERWRRYLGDVEWNSFSPSCRFCKTILFIQETFESGGGESITKKSQGKNFRDFIHPFFLYSFYILFILWTG